MGPSGCILDTHGRGPGMTQAEAWLLAYLIVWTLIGHWYALRRWEMRRKHKRRSQAARKAAATRKANRDRGLGHSPRSTRPAKAPAVRKPRAKKPLTDKVVTTESSWFTLEDEEDAPDYNEIDPMTWRPKVRRFDGTAAEYSRRDESSDNVE